MFYTIAFLCTETNPEESYFTTDGVNDMLYPRVFSKEFITAHCSDAFYKLPEKHKDDPLKLGPCARSPKSTVTLALQILLMERIATKSGGGAGVNRVPMPLLRKQSSSG